MMFRKFFLKIVASKKNASVLLLIGIFLISISAGIGFSRDVELTNAWCGWAPPALVWAADPSTKIVDKDYSSYQNLHIANSVIMWVYPLSNRLLGADPTVVQRFVIVISCLIYALAVVFLVRSLMPESPSAVTVVAVALALLTTTVDGDLARFGQGNFSLGQYYGFAVALQMVVVAFAIRGEILKCGISLASLIWIHPMIAAITALVAGVVLAVPRPLWKSWSKYLFAFSLVCLSAAIYVAVIKEGIAPRSRMPFEEWIDWVRFSNYHWFPFQLGVFTWENDRRIGPLLSVILLALGGDAGIKHNLDSFIRWIIAVSTCVFLILIGLFNSLVPLSMILTMASLHRASGLLLLLALPFACLNLYNAIKAGGLKGVLAVVVIVSPFLGAVGFPLLLSLALFFSKQPSLALVSPKWRRVVQVAGFLVAGLAAANVLFLLWGLSEPLIAPGLTGPNLAWIVGVTFGIITVAARSINPSVVLVQKVSFYGVCAIFVFLVALRIQDNWEKHPKIVNRRLAEDYMEAQNWARNNTSPGSLFMTDPTHCYGWKDYSGRPSWGNFRDWIHSSIAYHGDLDLLNEGLRRARRLGVDPQAYLNHAKEKNDLVVSGKTYSDLIADLKIAYSTLNEEFARQLAVEEGIEYFVYQKPGGHKLNKKPVFENNSFIIYRNL